MLEGLGEQTWKRIESGIVVVTRIWIWASFHSTKARSHALMGDGIVNSGDVTIARAQSRTKRCREARATADGP
jgi:hypothetical protein